jgi:uncharacterized protein YjbI with pentapeptide repeats
MRPRTLTALAAVGLAVAAPVALAGQQSTTIGTGAKTCVLGPGADCRGVVHRWSVEHHGNLRKAKFTKADLRGADFRGADLRGADLRGAKLRHADLRGAKLKGARFDAPLGSRKRANGVGVCSPRNCQGADLISANLTGAFLGEANLTGASLDYANLSSANLTGANLTSAWLSGTNLTGANLTGANLTGANLTTTMWWYTTCPDATVTNTGC